VWNGNTPNHTYLLNGNKITAYIREGETEAVYFKTPLMFDKRNRKFITLSVNPFKTVVKSDKILIEGSRGAVYELDKTHKTCSCPGFQFRRKCKHVENI